MLNALNEVLRDDFIKDAVARHRALEQDHREDRRRRSASRRRTRRSTARSARSPARAVDPDGRRRRRGRMDAHGERSGCRRAADRAFVASLMGRVVEPGKFANWIAPPAARHQQPADRLRVRALRLMPPAREERCDERKRIAPVEVLRQHLIDPEICIRCNTCEETCPVDAITHDERNYVVDAAMCNCCMAVHLAVPDRRDRQLAPGAQGEAVHDRRAAHAGTRCRRRPTLETGAGDATCRPMSRGSRRSRPRARAATRRRRGRRRIPTSTSTRREAGDRDRRRQLPLTERRREQRHPPHRARLRRVPRSRCSKASRSASCRRASTRTGGRITCACTRSRARATASGRATTTSR